MTNTKENNAKIIAISANKGGVLKTSITTNLGATISLTQKKVLLIDLDNQGNVAVSFGINPDDVELTVYDVLTGNIKNPLDAIITVSDNLDILVANDDMAYIEMDVLTDSENYPSPLTLLQEPINELKKYYDFIIIDTPPAMGLIAANVFNTVEDVILPYHPEVYSFRSMVKSMQSIANFKKTNTVLNVNSVVPVKVRETLTHEAFLQSAQAICTQNKVNFSDTAIPESIKYAEAIGKFKSPVVLLERPTTEFKKYIQIYKTLAKELGYIG